MVGVECVPWTHASDGGNLQSVLVIVVIIIVFGELVYSVIISYIHENIWYIFFPLKCILVMRYLNFLIEGNRHVTQGFLILARLAFGAR